MAPSRRPRSRGPGRRFTDGRRGWRDGAGAGLAAFALVLGLATCRPPTPAAGVARAWAAGPVRWLLQPEEERALRRIRTAAELDSFQRGFWDRRHCCDHDERDDFQRLFEERVTAADRLYAEGETPGSLTERGGALILLGPPRTLRYARTRVPQVSTAPGRGAPRPTSSVRMEVWVYAREALPGRLQEELSHEGDEVSLSFLLEPRGTRLLQGREVLETAARAALREVP